MTERWQREVRKLGTVEPERDAWNRAATRAPDGDGLPPPRQRVVAGVVAFGVFFAAASFGWLALRPSAERTPGEVTEGTEALVTLRIGTEGSDTFPIATLKVDGVIHVGQAAPGNVWDLEGTPIPWLEGEPPVRSRDYVTIELPATLELAGDADGADAILHDPKSTFWAGAEGYEIGPLGSPLPLEAPPGRYVLEVLGHWRDHGDPSFYFPIELVEPTGTEVSAPDVGVIRCKSDGSTAVQTPQVAVQADGVHLRVPVTSGAGALSIFPEVWEDGVQTSEFPRGIEDEGYVLAVPAGSARVACNWPGDEDQTSRDELAASVPIEFVNEAGVYHLDELPCPHGSRTYPDHPGLRAYAAGNDHVPMPDVIRRAVPGILASDVVEYGGYPQAEERFRSWRVVRDGEVAAVLRHPGSFGGMWTFGPIETCEGTDIGSPSAPTAGLTGSPFSVPGFERCDPYAETCELVYVEVDAYRALDGEKAHHSVPYTEDAVICFEDYVFLVDCRGQPEGTIWLALRMSPATKGEFVSRFGCGASVEDLCTAEDVSSGG